MTLIPQDAIQVGVDFVEDLIGRLPELAGWTVGGTLLQTGLTPNRHIRVSVVGSEDYHRVGDRVSLRFQVWRDGTEIARNGIANQLLAHARASLYGRKESGPVTLPDPVDGTKHLTQFEVSVLLIGEESA